MKSSSHSSTENQKMVAYPNYARTRQLRVKGIEARDFSTFIFSHWVNKLRFLIERHSKLNSEIKNSRF
jgi:hypothetical protein